MKKKSHYGTIGSILIPDEDIKEFTLPEVVETALEERTKEILELIEQEKHPITVYDWQITETAQRKQIRVIQDKIKTKYGL